MISGLSEKALELIDSQQSQWPFFAKNLDALRNIQTRSLRVNGFEFKVQFNPARIISSAAKVDSTSISERPCFLCQQNRPSEQKGINFTTENGNSYEILCNPFPIAPLHLTIVADTHTPQRIGSRLFDMLETAENLHDFVIFYNGPNCGASAPDHMHFQACNKGFLSIESYLNADNSSSALDKYPAKAIVIQGEAKAQICDTLQNIFSKFTLLSGAEDEPMINLLCWKSEQQFTVVVFPRRAHRPWQYFAEGNQNITISPASIDLAGVFIAPIKNDFDKITANDIEDILQQISVDETTFSKLK